MIMDIEMSNNQPYNTDDTITGNDLSGVSPPAQSADKTAENNNTESRHQDISSVFDPGQLLGSLDGDTDMLKEIIDIFLETSSSDVQELQKAVSFGNSELAEQKAHRLKGAAANIGAETTRKIAFEIEQSAKTGDCGKLNHLFEKLEREMYKLKEKLSEFDWNNIA